MTTDITAEDQEMLQGFVAECREWVEECEHRLIECRENMEESDGIDDEFINSMFRMLHSMKGTGAFLHLNNVSTVAHAAETCLDIFREGKAQFKKRHTDLFSSHSPRQMTPTSVSMAAQGWVWPFQNNWSRLWAERLA
ncbi:MAG: Hpt domain-containing protein [Pseudomonadota bacterium]